MWSKPNKSKQSKTKIETKQKPKKITNTANLSNTKNKWNKAMQQKTKQRKAKLTQNLSFVILDATK